MWWIVLNNPKYKLQYCHSLVGAQRSARAVLSYPPPPLPPTRFPSRWLSTDYTDSTCSDTTTFSWVYYSGEWKLTLSPIRALFRLRLRLRPIIKTSFLGSSMCKSAWSSLLEDSILASGEGTDEDCFFNFRCCACLCVCFAVVGCSMPQVVTAAGVAVQRY